MVSHRGRLDPLAVLAIMAVDVLIIFDAFSVAYLLRFELHLFATNYFEPAPVSEYFKAMVVVSYFWIMLFFVAGLYDYRRHWTPIDTVHRVTRVVSFGTLIILSLTYFYRDFSFSRLVCVYAWLISIVLFSGFRVALALFRSDWCRSGRDLRSVVVIGSKSLARYLIDRTKRQRELGYRVIGVLDDEEPDEELACEYLGPLAALPGLLESRDVDGVLIAHPALGHYALLDVIQVCESREVPIRMVPPTFDLMIDYRDFEEVDGVPLVQVNEKSGRRVADLVKRGIDLVVASVGLVLTLPLWAVIAALIRREDGGPVFFSQRRIGREGRPFRMLKFRTMVCDAEERLGELVDLDALEEPVYKLADDPRVTRIGRLLRMSSLDEVPQLINVILGEMSLVGPRPEDERLVRQYDVWERRRLKAVPGLTGLQQIKCRGCESLSERVRWDMLYVRKRSILLDLWILLQTVWVVLAGKGAR